MRTKVWIKLQRENNIPIFNKKIVSGNKDIFINLIKRCLNENKSNYWGITTEVLLVKNFPKDRLQELSNKVIKMLKYDNFPYICELTKRGTAKYLKFYIIDRHFYKNAKLVSKTIYKNKFTGKFVKKGADDSIEIKECFYSNWSNRYYPFSGNKNVFKKQMNDIKDQLRITIEEMGLPTYEYGYFTTKIDIKTSKNKTFSVNFNNELNLIDKKILYLKNTDIFCKLNLKSKIVNLLHWIDEISKNGYFKIKKRKIYLFSDNSIELLQNLVDFKIKNILKSAFA